MGESEKTNNKIDKVVGQAKEKVGGAVGNESLEAEVKKDQSKSDLNQAGENEKDAFKR